MTENERKMKENEGPGRPRGFRVRMGGLKEGWWGEGRAVSAPQRGVLRRGWAAAFRRPKGVP